MVDLEKLKKIYNFGKDLSFSDIQILLKNFKIKSFKRGEYLIKEGQLEKEIFFIRKGLVRGFKVNDKGEEITSMLLSEDQFFSCPHLTLFDEPAKHYFEALEPTSVFSIDNDKMHSILDNHPKLGVNSKHFYQSTIRRALKRIDGFVMLSPEERYLDFINSNPNIANRVPDKYIAHVLGVTPVSLSRIRKRIAFKKNQNGLH